MGCRRQQAIAVRLNDRHERVTFTPLKRGEEDNARRNETMQLEDDEHNFFATHLHKRPQQQHFYDQHHDQQQQHHHHHQQHQQPATSISFATLANNLKMPLTTSRPTVLATSLLGLLLILTICCQPTSSQGISIRPGDFERLIMPCFLGGGGGGAMSGSYGSGQSNGFYGGGGGPSAGYGNGLSSNPMGGAAYRSGSGGGGLQNGAAPSSYMGGSSSSSSSLGRQSGSSGGGQYGQPSPYYGTSDGGRLGAGGSPPQQQQQAGNSYIGSTGGGGGGGSQGLYESQQARPLFNSAGAQTRDGLTNNLGQSVPRANTIDNFIALVSKIEVANPRLANNPEQLIKSLLGRFHLDNYYYDVRMRTPISDQDRRYSDIVPALMNSQQLGGGGPFASNGLEMFPELLLDQDEKCSMYFMLSHFIDKSSASSGSAPGPGYAGNNPPLYQVPVQQLAGPAYNQRPPSLQAAGSGYPAQSAQAAYSSGGGVGGGNSRYPGPAPSFGSPATSNMNAFGTGISNINPEYTGKSPYGVNTPLSGNSPGNSQPYNSLLANSNLRNPNAAFPGASGRPPYIDASRGGQRGAGGLLADDRVATEYGVVTLPNQENAAIVLNRVLLGLLAATTPPQTIRQLAATIYPTQTPMQTPKLDEEIDPLFAVTLADLWAIGAIPKPGKQFDIKLLGDNGHWNDTMCPTSFTLDRPSSIKFTTAELLGGLDGFNLGMLRRRLMQMRKNLKLSEILRIYYSRNGFRPQMAEFGVCQRSSVLMNQMDGLHRQAENYLRLYQLSSPMSDNDIATMISRLDYFNEFTRQTIQLYTPGDLCADSMQSSDLYPMNGQDQCEISRADVVSVLDTSPEANAPFMQLVVAKLAQKLGLSRDTNSFSILTNQQDSTGYAGAYSFNAILRNSTNLGEIGCALVHDTTSSYQGGQVTDPTRLMEMFERALINLDTEYLTRQQISGIGSSLSSSTSSSWGSSYRQSSYISTWFGSSGADQANLYMPGGAQGGPRNTGGAKVVVWFNYGGQARQAASAGGPTNWGQSGSGYSPTSGGSSSPYTDQIEYKFYEAKKYLRENFRGASILAVSPNRDEVKAYVYDEERDIFTDVPGGGSSSLGGSQADFYPTSGLDAASSALLSGPAESLTGKLLQRMCTIPSLFQYPMCFRVPSSNEISVGYISPGRKQYWMMSPKSFFASRSVRLAFKVDGGRLRVCFGRQPNPDETALRNPQLLQNQGYNQQQQGGAISFAMSSSSSSQNGQQQQQQPGGLQTGSSTPAPQTSSSDYYTGMEYGVCKDVGLNQEIDFLISDPCWKKSIAECEPFYFVVRETSQPGEGDPNYMCRDAGCKRFDQAKFVMSHSGVSCSSATRGARASWLLILISAALVTFMSSSQQQQHQQQQQQTTQRTQRTLGGLRRGGWRLVKNYSLGLGLIACYVVAMQPLGAEAQQQAGVYDFGQNRYGEKRGNLTPYEVLAIILIVMLNLAGLALTVGLCYYVTKRAKQRSHTPVPQEEY